MVRGTEPARADPGGESTPEHGACPATAWRCTTAMRKCIRRAARWRHLSADFSLCAVRGAHVRTVGDAAAIEAWGMFARSYMGFAFSGLVVREP